MSLYLNYTIPVKCPTSEKEVEAECYFYFYEGCSGNYLNPPEPAEVDLIAVNVFGVNVTKDFTFAQILKIEGELLEYALQNN